jgi:hypothetical protein
MKQANNQCSKSYRDKRPASRLDGDQQSNQLTPSKNGELYVKGTSCDEASSAVIRGEGGSEGDTKGDER